MSREALTQVNVFGADWQHLKAYLEYEKDIAMQIVCGVGCNPEETERMRGKIMFIKTLLAQAEAIAKARTSGNGR